MFEDLPENTYSVKVGFKKTKAKYYVKDTEKVRDLLANFTQQ